MLTTYTHKAVIFWIKKAVHLAVLAIPRFVRFRVHGMLTEIMANETTHARVVIALRARLRTATNFQQTTIGFNHAASRADPREIRRFATTAGVDMRKEKQIHKVHRRRIRILTPRR
jgi:hypothetical protein